MLKFWRTPVAYSTEGMSECVFFNKKKVLTVTGEEQAGGYMHFWVAISGMSAH